MCNSPFHGKEQDTTTGLQYFGARWYDPMVGRFMAVDPVGVKADKQYLQNEAAYNFNRYVFANNNPHKFIDPDGRDAKDVNLIVDTFMSSVADMVKKGQRLDGGGGMVGTLNNNVSADNGYGWMIWLRQELLQKPATLVCYEQWDVVKNALSKNTYQDKWTFEMIETPGHYFGKATSNNPKDPDIYLDPWKNKVDMRYDKTSPDLGGSLLSKIFQ